MSAVDDHYIDLKPGKKCISIKFRHILIWSGRESDGSYIQGRPTNENENVLIDIIVRHRAELAQLRADRSQLLDDVATLQGTLRATVAEARAELFNLRSRSAALSDLLAVIHRDGGQYEQAHGNNAALTGQGIVVELRATVAEQARQLAAARYPIEMALELLESVYLEKSGNSKTVIALRAWLAANPAPEDATK